MKNKYINFLMIPLIVFFVCALGIILNYFRINIEFPSDINDVHCKKIYKIGKFNIVEIHKYILPDATDLSDYNSILCNFYDKYFDEVDKIELNTFDKGECIINQKLEGFLIDYCYERKNPFFRFRESYNAYGSIIDSERIVERGLYLGNYCLCKSIDYFFVEEGQSCKYLYNFCFIFSKKHAAEFKINNVKVKI